MIRFQAIGTKRRLTCLVYQQSGQLQRERSPVIHEGPGNRQPPWPISQSKKRPMEKKKTPKALFPSRNLNEHLIRGYYNQGQMGRLSLQLRLTLDQYFYTDLQSTTKRDDDQVVYRYTKNYQGGIDAKMFSEQPLEFTSTCYLPV